LFSLTEGNGYVHEGASHRFVMWGLEEREVGSNIKKHQSMETKIKYDTI